MLMIESDAGGAAAEAELDRAERPAPSRWRHQSSGARQDATEADWLREARREAHWSLEQAGVARMDDVGVPRSAHPGAARRHRADQRPRTACGSASSGMPATATSTRRSSSTATTPTAEAADQRARASDL